MKFAKSKRKGLKNGKLAACPNSPNCVLSENLDGVETKKNHQISGISFDQSDSSVAWQQVRESVIATGGKIQSVEDGYLWATYTSKIMRYVDDLELRLDDEAKVIHVRSVSRVGYSDMGANRKRVEKIRKYFVKQQQN